MEEAPAAAQSSAQPLATPKAKKAFRKRKRDDGDDSDGKEDGGPAVDLAAIRELREEQKLRARSKGVDSAALIAGLGPKAEETAAAEAAAAAAAAAEADAPKYGLQPGAKKEKEASILGGGFRAGTGLAADGAENPLMKEFIEQRIAEMTGKASASSSGKSGNGNSDAAAAAAAAAATAAVASAKAAVNGISATADEAAWLYELPEHLRPVAPRSRGDADVGEGGMMLSGTGIVEVTLPVTFKLRNMEETERMKAAVLAKRAARADGSAAADDASGGGGGTGLRPMPGGSLTANYNLHRREFAMNMRGPPRDPNDRNNQQGPSSSSSAAAAYSGNSGIAQAAASFFPSSSSSGAAAGGGGGGVSANYLGSRSASAPLDFSSSVLATAAAASSSSSAAGTSSSAGGSKEPLQGVAGYGQALYGQQHAYHQAYVSRGGGRGGGRGGRVHSSDNAVFAAFKRREVMSTRNH